jgi:hypothetical protein
MRRSKQPSGLPANLRIRNLQAAKDVVDRQEPFRGLGEGGGRTKPVEENKPKVAALKELFSNESLVTFCGSFQAGRPNAAGGFSGTLNEDSSQPSPSSKIVLPESGCGSRSRFPTGLGFVFGLL